MLYQVGEKVVHKHYGLGEIVQLDEKQFSGHLLPCYMVRIRDLTLWVPIDETKNSNLRAPTSSGEFQALFDILRSPGEPLSMDRLERKIQLQERMKDGQLESICKLVRDLTFFRQQKSLNENDNAVLARAQDLLLTEWKLALSVSSEEAAQLLRQLLADKVA
jgi:RNA polymerase-interacting CarD/CdnL/TRCF family regulator